MDAALRIVGHQTCEQLVYNLAATGLSGVAGGNSGCAGSLPYTEMILESEALLELEVPVDPQPLSSMTIAAPAATSEVTWRVFMNLSHIFWRRLFGDERHHRSFMLTMYARFSKYRHYKYFWNN